MDTLINRYQEVQRKIDQACQKAGRKREEVTLVAVSKTKPAGMILDIYGQGQRAFGENKPQELRDKIPLLPEDIRWHMIGHLQRNKIKYVVGRACMIHSVDSLRLGEAISLEAQKQGIVMDVLVEVNIAGEETKYGVRPEETEALIRSLSVLEGIRVKGLMTIAPYVEDPEQNRVHFRNLRNLSIDIASKNIDNVSVCELSMGMTNDFQAAIEEGATYVRVGSGIFGERDYHTEK